MKPNEGECLKVVCKVGVAASEYSMQIIPRGKIELSKPLLSLELDTVKRGVDNART